MSGAPRVWSPTRDDTTAIPPRRRGWLPSCDPTFLIFGAQKSGTTWLYRQLLEHPDIGLAEPKELHFFSDQRCFAAGLADYRRHFHGTTNAIARGEATPNYLWVSDHRTDEWGGVMDDHPDFRAGTPQRVAELLGTDLRLVVMLRDPVQRAVSAFYHHLHARDGRLDPHATFRENARRWGIVTMGFYAAHLTRWLQAFPPERLLVLCTEEVHAAPQQALAAVHRHLGVTPVEVDDAKARVHTGDKHGSGDVWYWDEQRTRVAIGPDELAQLAAVYAPENARLRTLLDRPLPDWTEPSPAATR